MTPKALSREIKFRVYNQDWKMMVLPEDIYYIKFNGENNQATDVAFNITTTDGVRNNEIWEDTEDIVFMQFTGLHDNNGIEIYEGDLLKNGGNNPPAEVIYKDGCFYAGRYGCELWRYSGNNKEIIGNIYENPELLN